MGTLAFKASWATHCSLWKEQAKKKKSSKKNNNDKMKCKRGVTLCFWGKVHTEYP